jgi:hypothetical protein
MNPRKHKHLLLLKMTELSKKVKFTGPQSERFQSASKNQIGPGDYKTHNSFTHEINQKPHSKLGVYIVKSIRFPDIKNNNPGAGTYSFTNSKPVKESIQFNPRSIELKNYYPGPGTYNVNFAVGRHVFNDYTFQLSKSGVLKDRDEKNRSEIKNLKSLVGKNNDIFTDKKACRRMAYFALYYPQS